MIGIGRKAKTNESHSRNLQHDGRVCFVCQGTGYFPREQNSLGSSTLITMQNSGLRAAPKTYSSSIEELAKLERERVRLDRHKKSLLKTIECIQRHQNIIEQKEEYIQSISEWKKKK